MIRSSFKNKALKGKFKFLFGAFFFSPFFLFAQTEFNRNCIEAYKDILSFRFTEAEKIILAEKSKHPSNATTEYLQHYIEFLQAFTTEEQSQLGNFKKDHDRLIPIVEKSDQHSPFYNYFLGTMHLQSGMIKTRSGEYSSAAIEYKLAYHKFQDNLKLYRDFIPQYSGLGLVHVFAGILPDRYSWLVTLFGMKGDVPLGLSELSAAARYSGNNELFRVSRMEAVFYLSFIDANLGKESENILQVLRIFDKQDIGDSGQSIPLLIYSRAKIFLRFHRNEEAIRALAGYQENLSGSRFCWLDYLKGMTRLNQLDLSAEDDFSRFLNEFHGKSYIRSARQKLAWCSLLKGDTSKYRELMKRVEDKEASSGEEDKQALREATSNQLPNVALLRARLLFDGGYYDRALHELLDRNLKKIIQSSKDIPEYHYRLGRIYQEKGEDEKALSYFDKAIGEGKRLPYYLAANAALQSGLIYEEKKDLANAEKYFRLCLEMDYPDYKTSIDLKARAGLQRLNKK